MFQRAQAVIGVYVGIALGLYPALARVDSKDDLDGAIAPMFWPIQAGAGLMAAALLAWAIRSRGGPSFAPFCKALLASFFACYMVVLIIGFTWTGNWLRFAAFRLGLQHEQRLATTDLPSATVYDWGGWGFAGYEGETYLIFDRARRLDHENADGRVAGLSCPVGSVRRMAPSWYLLVTFECSLPNRDAAVLNRVP